MYANLYDACSADNVSVNNDATRPLTRESEGNVSLNDSVPY